MPQNNILDIFRNTEKWRFTFRNSSCGKVIFSHVDTIDMVEGVCNGFLPYTRFLGFLEFSGYHQWQQESQ